jgi:hypothetical protein
MKRGRDDTPEVPRFPVRAAKANASAVTQANAAKRIKLEVEQQKSRAEVADILMDFAVNPLDFSNLEGDAAKYVKYLKDKLGTKSPAIVVATKAFGPKVVADFIANRKAVRYMFAPADNTAQCVRAGLVNPPAADTKCWLCGFELYRDGKPVDVIACEHILPVIQAVMFADIALPKTPATSQADLVKAEYAWAHTACNGPKSSSVFIKEITDDTGRIVRWDIDDTEIIRVLRLTIPEIKKLNIDGGQLSQAQWLKDRLVSIKEKIQPILNKINFGEDTVRMNILFGVAKIVDPERWASRTPLDEEAYAEYADQVIENAADITLSQIGSGKYRKTKRHSKRKHRNTSKRRKY